MKKLVYITFVLLSLFRFVKAQTSSSAVYVHAFLVDNPMSNSTIQAEYGKLLTISGTLSININPIKSSFNFAMTSIAIMNGNTVLEAIDGPTFSKASDFHNDSDISNAKPFNFTIQSQDVSNILDNYPNAKLVVRYKFTNVGSNFYYPQSFEYIGEFYVDNNKYGFLKVFAATTFSGPNNICSEAIYTLTDPWTITLENAGGIATLTSLGNNQWKITRTGLSRGKVILKSSVEGQNFTKEIQVGSAPINISAPNSVLWGREYNIHINPPGTGYSNFELYLENNNNRAALTKINDSQYKMTTEVLQRYPGMPDLGPIFILRIKYTDSCGEEIIVRRTIQAVNSTKPIPIIGG